MRAGLRAAGLRVGSRVLEQIGAAASGLMIAGLRAGLRAAGSMRVGLSMGLSVYMAG
jgi:hypothetical protein